MPDCGGPGDSPCIDSGDPSLNDMLFPDCDHGLGDERSDIGAFGGQNEGPPVEVTNREKDEKTPVPEQAHVLKQNFPNPFNPVTTITYTIKENAEVSLRVYDMKGSLVCILVEEVEHPGTHSVIWHGTNDNSIKVSSGVYICVLTAGDVSESIKMIILK